MRLFKQRNDNYIFPEVYRTIFFDIRISLFYIVIIRRISLYLSVFRFIRYRTFFHRVYASNIVKDKSAKNQEQYPFLRYEFFPFSDFSPVRFSEWKEAYQSCTITPPPSPPEVDDRTDVVLFSRKSANFQFFLTETFDASRRVASFLFFVQSLAEKRTASIERSYEQRTNEIEESNNK